LNVVLYRSQWGNTPWTAVEDAAIKDSCLATSYKSLFFFAIEPTDTFPKWLPETHVRFNYADFSLDQAVGAIKARVQERGGHFTPLTPARKGELLQAEADYRRDRDHMLSSIGSIFQEVEKLFAEICRQCEEVNAGSNFHIEHRVTMQPRNIEQVCQVGQDRVSISVAWYQPYANSLDTAALMVREFDGNIILPPGYVHLDHPKVLKERKYGLDVAHSREYEWHMKHAQQSPIFTKDFAARVVIEFLDLLERDRSGKIQRQRN
jgi:hypothetical protein